MRMSVPLWLSVSASVVMEMFFHSACNEIHCFPIHAGTMGRISDSESSGLHNAGVFHKDTGN